MKQFALALLCFFSLLLFPALLSAQAVVPAAATPDPYAKMRAALATAQTVFLLEEDKTPGDRPVKVSADFLTFYAGIQALGRYQLVPAAREADLIFFYQTGPSFVPHRSVAVVDGKTLVFLGYFQASGNGILVTKGNLVKGAEQLVADIKQLAGDSKAADPITAFPVPAALPISGTVQEFQLRLQKAHTILSLGGGISQYSPTQDQLTPAPDSLLALFNSAMTNWGRYKIVSNLEEADLVIKFDDTKYAPIPHERALPGGLDGYNATSIAFFDPKTLQVVGAVPITGFGQGGAMNVNIQILTDAFAYKNGN